MGGTVIETGLASPAAEKAAIAQLRREQAARKAAENLLATRDRELVEAKQHMEQLLGGGIKLMTDTLALARPELFQKAAKVQRWARRLSDHMPVERKWELDLASLLYPLGVISLPDDLVNKYVKDMRLDDEETLRLEESALVASRLIANIPRMKGVARAVFYSRRGFDGSGWPKDGPKGMELPQSARILKVIIDLADEATGKTRNRAGAFERMSMHREHYDPKIFATAYRILLEPVNETRETRLLVETAQARLGDVVVHDVLDSSDRLLLAAGVELTEMSAGRLAALAKAGDAPDEIVVLRKETVSEPAAAEPATWLGAL